MKKLLALCASVRFALGFPSEKQQIDVVAAVLWAEARSEGCSGIDAVAEVILNRTQRPSDFSGSIYGVVTQARQFSCLNNIAPSVLVSKARHSEGLDGKYWIYSRLVAKQLIHKKFFHFPSTGALFFTSSPHWITVPGDWGTPFLTSKVGKLSFYQ